MGALQAFFGPKRVKPPFFITPNFDFGVVHEVAPGVGQTPRQMIGTTDGGCPEVQVVKPPSRSCLANANQRDTSIRVHSMANEGRWP